MEKTQSELSQETEKEPNRRESVYNTHSTNTTRQKEKISFKRISLFAIKLIVSDFLWIIPLTIFALVILLLRLYVPLNSWCILLKVESGSNTPINLPKAVLILEILSAFVYYVLPFSVCFILLDDTQSRTFWSNDLVHILKKWPREMLLTGFFMFLDMSYRVIMYFIFIHSSSRDNPLEYPQWIALPLNMNWLIGMFVIVTKTVNRWVSDMCDDLVFEFNLDSLYMQAQCFSVKKEVRKAIIHCLLGIMTIAVVIQQLMLVTFKVSEEVDRTALIAISVATVYPLWIYMDRRGRKPISWTEYIRLSLFKSGFSQSFRGLQISQVTQHYNTNSSRRYVSQDNVSIWKITDWIDPMERNGFILSTFTVTGMIITVRLLQANMDNLASKLATGILASCMKSFFMIAKPHMVKRAKVAASGVKKRLIARVGSNSINQVVPSKSTDQVGAETLLKMKAYYTHKVFLWHRAHMIIIINRLELFSILVGNILVVVVLKRREQAMSYSKPEDCHMFLPKYFEVFIGMILVCCFEFFFQYATYVYMLVVEKLPLNEIRRRGKLTFCFLLFMTMVLFFLADQLLTTVFVVLSCDKLNSAIYNYHCVAED